MHRRKNHGVTEKQVDCRQLLPNHFGFNHGAGRVSKTTKKAGLQPEFFFNVNDIRHE